ncbi:MAG: helicase-associated domain-containing protein [Luteococcus sp.]|uniref:helicase-associated domain-containing protein n=1 Tax=Luteococcus sp. TaxID=1969402 RepID=UPI0026472A25|nr:helicase-associated domain-containing protein [Luteococcus sp.]MDN5564239.1 helicase-associated domain-containing protein [Luteococcus sp.]
MNAPRSMADVVRGMSPDELTRLVDLRPDLALPRPQDLAELVERALGATSTQLALEGLDAWQRRVALALAASPDAISTRHLAALMGAERSAVAQTIHALQRRALLWGNERGWHITHAVRAAFGSYPAGLPGESVMPLPDHQIDEALAAVGEPGRAVLERLLWENPTGRVAQADRRGSATSTRPVDQLLHHRLVRPLDSETVILPREVALRLRGGRLFPDEVSPVVPPWPAGSDSRVADRAGLGSAFELVSTVEVLIEEVGRRQPRPLATGALPKKELTALAREGGGPQRTLLALLVAERAGLVASTASAWLPSEGYDEWLALDGWGRWIVLRDAWLALDAFADVQAPALAPGNTVAWAGALRRLAIEQLRAAPEGAPVEAPVLASRLAWLKPAWARLDLELLAGQVVTEASWFGLVALGRRTGLVDAVEDPGFPQPADEFMVQSDLTAVTPAPLRAEVMRTMALVADRESSGGAGVYRFTADSIRRALDAGWGADEVRGWIREHSLTPVPQALDYLVDDVARRHGLVQVAAVASVVTVDDPVTVDAILGRPGATELGLRRLAPTVLAAAAEPADVVIFLRELGLAPVAQDASGARFTTPASRRAKAHVPPAPIGGQRVDAHAVVSELLVRDEGRRHAAESGNLLKALEDSIGKPGWWHLDHVADDGTRRTAEVRVLALTAGQARLMKKAEGPFTLPVSRMISLRKG